MSVICHGRHLKFVKLCTQAYTNYITQCNNRRISIWSLPCARRTSKKEQYILVQLSYQRIPNEPVQEQGKIFTYLGTIVTGKKLIFIFIYYTYRWSPATKNYKKTERFGKSWQHISLNYDEEYVEKEAHAFLLSLESAPPPAPCSLIEEDLYLAHVEKKH